MMKIFPCILVFVFVACSSHDTPILNTATYVGESPIVDDTLLFRDPKVFPLETTENSLISYIDRIVEFNGDYYILDKRMKKVFAFDGSGNFQFAIHAVGGGLGEYVNVMDIAVDRRDSLLVLLSYPSELLYYDLKGSFVKNHKLSKKHYHALTIDNEFIYLAQSTYVNKQIQSNSLTVVSRKTNEEEELLQPLKEIAPYCFPRGYFLSMGLEPFFTRKFDDAVYRLDGASLLTDYTVDWGTSTFQVEKELYSCRELQALCGEKHWVYSMFNFQESARQLCFSTNLSNFYVLSKAKGTVTCYPKIRNIGYGVNLANYIPVSGDEPRLFFVFPAASLLQLRQLAAESTPAKKLLSPSMLEIVKDLKEDSNPIVFSYVLR